MFIPRLRWAAVAVLLLVAPSAHAQNYRDVPLGGRTATMGGAATASGNDSAMPYLNPAGLAGLPSDVFALSANVYSQTYRKAKALAHPNGFGTLGIEVERDEVSSSNLAQLPSSVMYVAKLGSDKSTFRSIAAVSLVIPSIQRQSILGTFRGSLPGVNGGLSDSRSVVAESTDYYLGPSYGAAVGDSFRIGASFYALYTRSRFAFQETFLAYRSSGATNQQETDLLTQEHSGTSFVGILGFQASPVKGLWIGVGAATPSVHIYGKRTDISEFNSRTPLEEQKTNTSLTGAARSERPLRINVGVSYDRPKSFGVAADLHYYAARADAIGVEGVGRTTVLRSNDILRDYNRKTSDFRSLDAVIDLSLGAEVWLNDAFALRLGAFTNGSAEKTDLETRYSQVIKRVGATAGVGVSLGSFDTTVGGVYQRGSGTMVAPDYYSPRALAGDSDDSRGTNVSITENTFMFVLSGVVTVEQARKTIKDTVPGGRALDAVDTVHGSTSTPAATPAPATPSPTPPATQPATTPATPANEGPKEPAK